MSDNIADFGLTCQGYKNSILFTLTSVPGQTVLKMSGYKNSISQLRKTMLTAFPVA